MLKYIFRISLSCLLLVYIGRKIDWRVIAEAFKNTDIIWYLLSTVIALSCLLCTTLKYRLLVHKTALSLSIIRLAVIYFISQFYALFLPTALGTEAVRWYKVTKGKQGKSFFLAATTYERILFLLTLVCSGMIPLLFVHQSSEILALRDRIMPVAIIFSLILAMGLAYLLNPKIHIFLNAFLKTASRIKKGGKLDLLISNLSLKDQSWTLLALLVLLTICWQFFYIIRIYLLFHAMNIHLGIAEAAWMGSLVLLLQVLPLSFAGLGIREGAYAYLFTLYGLPAEQGVVMGLLFFTQMMIFAFIGAVLNIFEK